MYEKKKLKKNKKKTERKMWQKVFVRTLWKGQRLSEFAIVKFLCGLP